MRLARDAGAAFALLVAFTLGLAACKALFSPGAPGWTAADDICVTAIVLAHGSAEEASAICGPGLAVVEAIVANATKSGAIGASPPPPAAVRALAEYRAAKAGAR